MKTLVVIAHYIKADRNSFYSSTAEGAEERRRKTLEDTLLCWRAHFSRPASLNIQAGRYDFNPTAQPGNTVDIVVLTNGENHALNAEMILRYDVLKWSVHAENPQLLPFGAHKVMADRAGEYDWFIYSEDDIAVRDPFLFHKLRMFQEKFGAGRVLAPNRFELNPAGVSYKTYIDSPVSPNTLNRLYVQVKEENQALELEADCGKITFGRAANPHAGFFALTREQLNHWKNQPYFMDMDCSFVSPLESACALGIAKTFSVFKAASPPCWFEVEHMDRKFSNARFGR